MANAMRHFFVKIQNVLVNYLVTLGNSSNNSHDGLVRLGTSYGGWWVPRKIIEETSRNRVSLSIGIGHDVSFDKELLKSGFEIIALDPIEECVSFAKKELEEHSRVYLANLGLLTYSGQERFFCS